MDNDFKIWEHQADAYKRLNRALDLSGGLNAGDLLGANTRAHVTRLMTESGTARTLFGLRQLSTHRLWRALVKRWPTTPEPLASCGSMVGFVVSVKNSALTTRR